MFFDSSATSGACNKSPLPVVKRENPNQYLSHSRGGHATQVAGGRSLLGVQRTPYMSYDHVLLASGGRIDAPTHTKNELRRARTRKKALKLAELDALLPVEYRRRKQQNMAGRRSLGLGFRTLEDVLQDTKRFLSDVRSRSRSAPAADQIEREPAADQVPVAATRHALESFCAPSLGSSKTTMEVKGVMRDGLLSSHSLMCIEIELSADAPMSPWTVVAASQGTRDFFAFAPWGELSGKDLLHIIHPADSGAFVSLDPRQRKGEWQDCYNHAVFVRFPRFFLHHFQLQSDVVADEIETSWDMGLPIPSFEETDPLFEDENHHTAFSHAALSPGGGRRNSGTGVFTVSTYQAMRVSISVAGKTAASHLRALLVLEHLPENKLELSASDGGGRAGGGAGGEIMTSAGAPDAAAVESINEVLEVLHVVNGIYAWNPETSTSTPGAIRADVGMNVSPVTQAELNYIARINQQINSWRQKGVVALTDAVYRMVQIHVDLRIGSNGLPIINLHARFCILGMFTNWRFLGRAPIDGSQVPFANGPPDTRQIVTWAHEPEDEGGKVIAFHRMVLVPETLGAFRFFSRTLLLSQTGTMTSRGALNGKMFEIVLDKIGEADLVLCRANDDDDQRPGFSLP